MRYLFIFLLALNTSNAENRDWEYERINFYFENDIFSNSATDNEYSDGGRLSAVMYRPDGRDEWLNIPFIDKPYSAHFISFALTQQIFTPDDLSQKELIKDDRPYAGWLYLEMGLHQSTATDLDSLSVQLGVVGPASGMEQLQKYIHEQIGSDRPEGWDHQLGNEVGLQLNYQHKWRYVPRKVWGLDSSLIPFVGGEFGNISIKANAGATYRIGWNVPEDFGSTSIDEGGENGIPIRTGCLCPSSKPWSLNLGLSAGASFVARDIFLDGNTFSDSHSVDKHYLKGYGSIGISARYENYSIDYIQTYHTRQFHNNKDIHNIGSVVLSYLFSS